MTPSVPAPTLDPTVIEDLRALDPDDPEGALAEVLEAYLEDAPARTARMAEALDAGDRGRVRAEAHALKGSSRTIGAMATAHACEQVEHSPDEGLGLAVRRVFTELERVFPAVRALRDGRTT